MNFKWVRGGRQAKARGGNNWGRYHRQAFKVDTPNSVTHLTKHLHWSVVRDLVWLQDQIPKRQVFETKLDYMSKNLITILHSTVNIT